MSRTPARRGLRAAGAGALVLATVLGVAGAADASSPREATGDDRGQGPRTASAVVTRYLDAIENDDLATLDRLFAPDVAYRLEFFPRPGGGSGVNYLGERQVLDYFKAGFDGFGQISNDERSIDQSTDRRVAWVRYYQRAEVPGSSKPYVNRVVERIQLDREGRIQDIDLFENPNPISVPDFYPTAGG